MNEEKIEDVLYNYFIHYNCYTGYYCAFKRDSAVQYLNGVLPPNDVIKHRDCPTLIKYISQLDNDTTKK